MALSLVVVNPFSTYRKGDIVTDAGAINAIRASEHYSQVVMRSDEPIPDPEPPPPLPDFASLQAAFLDQQDTIEQQQAALSAAVSINGLQTQQLQSQAGQLATLQALVLALEAKVNAGPGTGTPLPPNLADDLPLAEADGVVLGTNAGAILVGDIR